MVRDSRRRGVHLRRQRHSHTLITNNARQQRGVGSKGTKGELRRRAGGSGSRSLSMSTDNW